MLATGEPQQRAATLGRVLADCLSASIPGYVTEIRTIGLWAGIDLPEAAGRGQAPARDACEALLGRRVLVKDAHRRTIRVAPPIVIEEVELRWAVEQLESVLRRASVT